jgi:three-Cys-motif partner protein
LKTGFSECDNALWVLPLSYVRELFARGIAVVIVPNGQIDPPFKTLPRVDEIGPWSLVKLDIVKQYATAYSKILTKQMGLSHYYIDAFSGSGVARDRQTQELVLGSPRVALSIDPPFKRYVFIDLHRSKADYLRAYVVGRDDVEVFEEDCNEILLTKIFPKLHFSDFRRALCLLDPYGLHLKWEVIKQAGQLRTIEIFLNFPIHDINRNILMRNSGKRKPQNLERMDAYWGDRSWYDHVYREQEDLFGAADDRKVASHMALVSAFRSRLIKVAGFSYVPEPIAMRNTKGAPLYYLFFASPNAVGRKIVEHIFDKYRYLGNSSR